MAPETHTIAADRKFPDLVVSHATRKDFVRSIENSREKGTVGYHELPKPAVGVSHLIHVCQ